MIKTIVVTALVALPSPALAWGAEGHEIVAAIALRELHPAARRHAAKLLGSDSMLIHDSNWADEIREQRPEGRRWHFVDIPLDASGYDARRDCADDDCVVAQIARDMHILANRKLQAKERTEALRYLIHFAADVHQPLHAEDNDDRGGNGVRVYLRGQRTNLHHIWDANVVEALGYNADTVAYDIWRGITQAQRIAWKRGAPWIWANEAHAIARDEIYILVGERRTIRLSLAYPESQSGITRTQLAKAGLRLAWLLNKVLN